VKKLLFLFICVGCCAATTFDLDPAKTEIKFSVNSTLHTVHGTFKLKRGSIELDPDTGKASGEIVIDLPSGASGNGSRDKRLHKEILESQMYPEAAFTPDHVDGHIAAQGTSEIDVHGNFRIHGADHELTLHFQVQANGGQYTGATHFTIPYVQWGLKNPSNFLLRVDDRVEVEVRAVVLEKSQIGNCRRPAPPWLSPRWNCPLDGNLAFGQQFTFFQMAGFAGEVSGVRIVRDHDDRLAELLV
jgi:polyisoprenoid-binding protein YceI